MIVASSAHRAASIPSNGNYFLEKGEYTPEAAYNKSKIAAVHLANKIDRLHGSDGLHATSVHPGAIHTDLSRHLPAESLQAILNNPYVRKIMKSTEQGAATTVMPTRKTACGKTLSSWLVWKQSKLELFIRCKYGQTGFDTVGELARESEPLTRSCILLSDLCCS